MQKPPETGEAGELILPLLQRRVQVVVDHFHQLDAVVLQEVVAALQHAVVDLDVLLFLELLRQFVDADDGDDVVLVAVHDQARRRAGRQEREIVDVGRRGDGDEARDFRPAHHQLHGHPGAEGKAADPATPRVRVMRLHPVQGRGGVRELALAVVEHALRAADATEIESQSREAALHETLVKRIDDLVAHGAAVLRMRVQQQRHRRVGDLGVMIAAFEAAFGSVEDDFRHELD